MKVYECLPIYVRSEDQRILQWITKNKEIHHMVCAEPNPKRQPLVITGIHTKKSVMDLVKAFAAPCAFGVLIMIWAAMP